MPGTSEADLVLYNGRITTPDPPNPQAQALAMEGGKVLLAGSDAEAVALTGARTTTVVVRRQRIIPAHIDSRHA